MLNMLKLQKLNMNLIKFFKISLFILLFPLILTSCKSPDGKFKLPGGDARKTPADPAERVKKNLEEGRGFKLMDITNKKQGGVFEFASSNELWRASLDVLDFMPLSSVNYSGGIIITDWYNNNNNPEESIKISIRFLTNEIRSDALDIKVFTKKCTENYSCKIFETNETIAPELTKKILKIATVYEQEKLEKKRKKNKDYKYPGSD